jgi:hypothetical protein
MRRLAILLLVLVAACSRGDDDPQATATPLSTIAFESDAAEQSVLRIADLGDDWEREAEAAPSTIQIGGKVGPANVKGADDELTVAFKQKDDSGYVTNSVYGGATFRRTGDVDVPALGDEIYTAAINSEVRPGEGAATKRKIEYVVYRVDRMLSFVIAQDVPVSTAARRQEEKVARLTG